MFNRIKNTYVSAFSGLSRLYIERRSSEPLIRVLAGWHLKAFIKIRDVVIWSAALNLLALPPEPGATPASNGPFPTRLNLPTQYAALAAKGRIPESRANIIWRRLVIIGTIALGLRVYRRKMQEKEWDGR
jgi:hypothetical protein